MPQPLAKLDEGAFKRAGRAFLKVRPSEPPTLAQRLDENALRRAGRNWSAACVSLQFLIVETVVTAIVADELGAEIALAGFFGLLAAVYIVAVLVALVKQRNEARDELWEMERMRHLRTRFITHHQNGDTLYKNLSGMASPDPEVVRQELADYVETTHVLAGQLPDQHGIPATVLNTPLNDTEKASNNADELVAALHTRVTHAGDVVAGNLLGNELATPIRPIDTSGDLKAPLPGRGR